MDRYFKIGKLAAAHGTSGQMILQHSLGKRTALKGLSTLFVEAHQESFLPYFIESVKIKNENEVYVQLEGIATRERAQGLIKKEVWLTQPDFEKFAARSAPISLLGFRAFNEGVELGEISEVFEQPHQVLCKIMVRDKEVLIPVHDSFVERVDKNKKEIYLVLPEGLIELYTG
ncbi:MAG: 16S rRNA processing protein RimM [Bacteroidota bacterium]|nr:16S rRNA processing protein RimM [Bacteroidota bacterium]